MSVREGDLVEYEHLGEKFRAVVEAVLWVGGMKARIKPPVKGHPTTVAVNKLQLIKEGNR
jgi:hypothetical protein